MEINSTLLRERTPIVSLAVNGPVGAAATTVDIVSHIGVTATAANLTFTVPSPTDTRSGRDFIVTNTGTNAFTILGMRIDPERYCQFIWEGNDGAWQTPAVPLSSGADFWRADAGATMPNGVTDVTENISRIGKVAIGTAIFPNPATLLSLGFTLGGSLTDDVGKKFAIYDGGNDFYGLGVSPSALQFHANSQTGELPGMFLNNAGHLGINLPTAAAATSHLHVNGSFATNIFFFPPTGGTNSVNQNFSGVEIGASPTAFTHTVTLPAANLFAGRIIVVKLASGNNRTIVTVNAAGGAVENLQGVQGTTAVLQSGWRSGTWQSDGTNWQLISANADGIHRISASGSPGGIIPAGHNVYQDFNGTWEPNITLPVSGAQTGSIFTFEHFAVFNTIINTANTNLVAPLTVTAQMGGAAFIWVGTKWALITN